MLIEHDINCIFRVMAAPNPIPGMTWDHTQNKYVSMWTPDRKRKRRKRVQIASDIDVIEIVKNAHRARVEVRPKAVGVDLATRSHEVAKLFYAGYGRQAIREGLDLEETLQEVYLKIAVANAGNNPWNPEKSSFGHYVHLVCRSAFFNYREKVFRRRRHERTGASGYGSDGEYRNRDISELEIEDERGQSGYQSFEAREEIQSVLDCVEDHEKPIIERVACGYKLSEIKDEFGVSPNGIRRVLRKARSV